MNALTNDPKTGVCVAILLLAAGKASRMGENGPHKLLAEFDGVPLMRRSARIACDANADTVVIVTGHRHAEITAALDGLHFEAIYNADYASGMASSLIAGVTSEAAQRADGVLMLHADMPGLTTADLDRLIAVFRETKGKGVVRAVSNGKPGNPVILPRSLYDGILLLKGDVGARHLIETAGVGVIDMDIGATAHLDVDTPDAVVAAGGVLRF